MNDVSDTTDNLRYGNNAAKRWHEKALSELNLGNFDTALEYIDTALKLDADNEVVWNDKGIVLRNLGRLKEALICYEKAIECDPTYVDAWRNKGFIYDRMHKYNEAIECYELVLGFYPYDTDVLRWKDRCTRLSKKTEVTTDIEGISKTKKLLIPGIKRLIPKLHEQEQEHAQTLTPMLTKDDADGKDSDEISVDTVSTADEHIRKFELELARMKAYYDSRLHKLQKQMDNQSQAKSYAEERDMISQVRRENIDIITTWLKDLTGTVEKRLELLETALADHNAKIDKFITKAQERLERELSLLEEGKRQLAEEHTEFERSRERIERALQERVRTHVEKLARVENELRATIGEELVKLRRSQTGLEQDRQRLAAEFDAMREHNKELSTKLERMEIEERLKVRNEQVREILRDELMQITSRWENCLARLETILTNLSDQLASGSGGGDSDSGLLLPSRAGAIALQEQREVLERLERSLVEIERGLKTITDIYQSQPAGVLAESKPSLTPGQPTHDEEHAALEKALLETLTTLQDLSLKLEQQYRTGQAGNYERLCKLIDERLSSIETALTRKLNDELELLKTEKLKLELEKRSAALTSAAREEELAKREQALIEREHKLHAELDIESRIIEQRKLALDMERNRLLAELREKPIQTEEQRKAQLVVDTKSKSLEGVRVQTGADVDTATEAEVTSAIDTLRKRLSKDQSYV
jgi:tetratricopeptide (TPR) repeat protein